VLYFAVVSDVINFLMYNEGLRMKILVIQQKMIGIKKNKLKLFSFLKTF